MKDELRFQKAKQVSIVSIVGNLALTVIKLIVGFLSGSAALVADAFHSASDLVGTVILLKGMQIAHLPPDRDHPFGHHRAETITSEILALILILTAAGIGYDGINKLMKPGLIPPESIALVAAILSIVAKEAMYRYSHKIGTEINSDAILADAWHHRSDAFSSIAAFAGILGARIGFPQLDPIAALIVAFLILKAGISIYRRAVMTLMETAPSKEVLKQLLDAVEHEQGVKNVEDLRVRRYGSKMLIDLKISVLPHLTVEEGHSVAARAKERVMAVDESIQDVLIHVNPYYNTNRRFKQK